MEVCLSTQQKIRDDNPTLEVQDKCPVCEGIIQILKVISFPFDFIQPQLLFSVSQSTKSIVFITVMVLKALYFINQRMYCDSVVLSEMEFSSELIICIFNEANSTFIHNQAQTLSHLKSFLDQMEILKS